ncbi:DUF3025 domain-containing protein [Oxalobacteraceae bacterium OM1]|nr:DUF3025 domain-containing protein [Oxalobacteraceae bacterium OM1]
MDAQDWRGALNALACDAGLRNYRGQPISFVLQEDLPHGVAYEAFIGSTGCVPTRENLHDFFNALIWLTFPRTKVQLNALQSRDIETCGIGAARSPLRDAATIFDENAAILVVRKAKWRELLRAHRWREALWESRDAFWEECHPLLFGHALMEKLVAPYKAITAHTWIIVAPEAFANTTADSLLSWVDRRISADLAENALQKSTFSPLPVLGIPLWCDTQDAAFYTDTAVFRPPRRRPA